ncbi:hypothetical protein [Xylanimonas protaetiae]|uniref:Uncharacterized protein n=1 Tax=Xylanimonas protaetiae TaxID=2509457 RepID=A0A4P6F627_9MICO|nr:hypothetical protein [Xylanimonas protaetiae]QAY69739.1 hypothetical protein ET471_06535 [Xylanimonas protaetiae]
MASLGDVFGIGAAVESPSYVDRGQLDSRFTNSVAANRHVAVHGGSKQGKSWLRSKVLPDDQAVVIQCTPHSTPDSLLKEALGRLGVSATLSMTKTRELTGTLNFEGNVELGKILAKAKAQVGASGSIATSSETELAPIGTTAADLSWVSSTISMSGRRLVLEDFHYIDEAAQRTLAFMLKAMGEYGLFVVVIGVWPRDHLLTYYNGDLEGRVDDIHLTWNDAELEQVLVQGANALNISFSDDLRASIVKEAFGNVGLLHRIAARFCEKESVVQTLPRGADRVLDAGRSLTMALSEVAGEMAGRYQAFADNFVRGMRRLSSGLEVYRHLLEAVTDATDSELLAGIDSAVLLQRISAQEGGSGIRASDLTQALDRIDRLQVKIGVNPLVLTYNRSSRKLFLADNSFLFFRRHGQTVWPWSDPAAVLTNDLAIQDPLDFDFASFDL